MLYIGVSANSTASGRTALPVLQHRWQLNNLTAPANEARNTFPNDIGL